MRYSPERKEAVLRKMMPPHNRSIKELAEYCRKKGIFPEQVQRWRTACESANDWDREQNRRLKAEKKADIKRIRQLDKELKRKEKALAEAAALLVLQKKVQAIWGDPEEE
jgi:transposase-like protein